MDIFFTGYVAKTFSKIRHSNYWPWNYLTNTLRQLGYKAYHRKAQKIDHKKPHIYICWNSPDSLELLEKYDIHPDSIIIQKLTAFDKSEDYGDLDINGDAAEFLKKWRWPQYQKLEKLDQLGVRFYAFGCKTDLNTFPEKNRIVSMYKEKIFWIPWGSMTIPYEQQMKAVPVMDHFKYDLGFVGSRWGRGIRGNEEVWEEYLDPLLENNIEACLGGPGTKRGIVSVKKHVEILKHSRICPILHAPGWKVEKGIMDRFWTVFSLGRFGVCDNEGILEFYDENEVALAVNPEEYIDKSMYYMRNIDRQRLFIEAAIQRIQKEYNQRVVWQRIMEDIFRREQLTP